MNFTNQLKNKIDTKTKPVGSLGRLEEIAYQIAKLQNTLSPEIKNPFILVFAADHGLADEKISVFPKEVTAQMVMNFLKGGAAINVFCRQNNIGLKVIDAGVDFNFDKNENLIDLKLKYGTNNTLLGNAMSDDDCLQALSKGKLLINELYNSGTNTVGFGEMGIGNTSAASLIMHKICSIPLESCIGKGTGHDDKGMRHKKEILKKVTLRHADVKGPIKILAAVGGFEIAMICGAMLRAAELGMVILIDGFISTSALLVAHVLNNEILENCVFCHQSDEQGHKLILEYLNVKPLLNLGLRLGEGTGAAIALPVIQAAVNFLNEMASFESAGVTNK